MAWAWGVAGAVPASRSLSPAAGAAALLLSPLLLCVLALAMRWALVRLAALVAGRRLGSRYARFDTRPGALEGVLCVDCAAGAAPRAAFTLTHHRGGATAPSGEDTSTGLVLRAVERGVALPPRVTCNHFDVDGLLAVWAALAPRRDAERWAPLLRAAARLGDFREGLPWPLDAGEAGDGTGPSLARAALRLVAWLNAEEARLFTRPFAAARSQDRTGRKYRYFLPRLEGAMAAAVSARPPRRMARVWEAEVAQVEADLRELAGEGAIEHRAGGLAVVHTKKRRHYYALFSAAGDADSVLTVTPEGVELEQRYTSYVRYRSRPTWPRLDLGPLAAALNAEEVGGGEGRLRWVAGAHTDSGPILRLAPREERLTKAQAYGQPLDRPWHVSALDDGSIIARVAAYYATAARCGAKRRAGGWNARTVAALNSGALSRWTWGGEGVVDNDVATAVFELVYENGLEHELIHCARAACVCRGWRHVVYTRRRYWDCVDVVTPFKQIKLQPLPWSRRCNAIPAMENGESVEASDLVVLEPDDDETDARSELSDLSLG